MEMTRGARADRIAIGDYTLRTSSTKLNHTKLPASFLPPAHIC
jgi:hypothetical protein